MPEAGLGFPVRRDPQLFLDKQVEWPVVPVLGIEAPGGLSSSVGGDVTASLLAQKA